MHEVTGSLYAELQRMVERSDGSWAAIRLGRGPDGELRLDGTSDQHDAVVVASFERLPPLIASPELAAELEGSILHFRGAGDDRWGGPGVALLQTRAGPPRAEWSPPQTRSRRAGPLPWSGVQLIFRRRVASASTTQR